MSNEILDKESLTNLNDEVKKRVDLAWKCIVEQYINHAKKNSYEEGAGISIYRFLRYPKKDRSNCEYYYTDLENTVWNMIIQASPDGEKIKKLYNPSTMFMICIQIPLNDFDNQTIGSIKLFKYTDNLEVDLYSQLETKKDTSTIRKIKN